MEKRKILLIEDNLDMRENTAEILELAKYDVTVAENGKVGVEMALKNKPDLIICDVMMPELDGYGVLYMLGKNPETSNIPFIFLTAKAEKSDFRKGMDMGADDYLTKPFDDMELLSAVETRLKKSDILKVEFKRTMDGLDSFVNEARGWEELKKLSSERKVKKVRKKEFIYSEGDVPNGLYFIVKGKVKTYKMNESGKEYIVSLHNEGDFIGYLALLEDQNHSESAEVLEDAEVCFIPKEDFNSLVYRNRDVSVKFMKMLSNNLHEREEQLLRLAYNSVRKRVAEALLLLYNKYKKDEQEIFSMPVSREDLANIVGTSTESVIRTLSDFKDEGLVEIKGSTISLLQVVKLQKMKN